MRIAYFAEVFLPKIDGIVNTMCHMLDHLAEGGHDSLMFAPEGGPPSYANTSIVGLGSFAFPLYPELKLAFPVVPGVEQQLRAFQPDVVHLINPALLGVTGLHAAKALNLPVVMSYHTDLPGFAERWGLGFSSDFLWAYFRWLHNQADLNLCPSRATRRELEEQGFKNLALWGRGVDTDLFTPTRRSQEWRSRLSGGQPHLPLLVYVGRVSTEKRVDWLLPLIRSLTDAHGAPRARLAIVGDGPVRQELETLFANTPTVFTGYLSGDELASAYAAGDIFVFPAANETFGNVVLEALASGLPVVTPDSGGVTDQCLHEETGLLFPSEDQEAFIACVHRLLGNPALTQRLGRAGRARARTQTWEAILNGLLADYDRVIQTHRAAEQKRLSQRATHTGLLWTSKNSVQGQGLFKRSGRANRSSKQPTPGEVWQVLLGQFKEGQTPSQQARRERSH